MIPMPPHVVCVPFEMGGIFDSELAAFVVAEFLNFHASPVTPGQMFDWACEEFGDRRVANAKIEFWSQ